MITGDEIMTMMRENNANARPLEVMTDNFLNSIIFGNAPETISEILTIVDNPFIDRKGNDSISMIFHRFYKHTDIPLALPIFGFLSMISAWMVANEANMRIPLMNTTRELNTWVMALADSGASKTLTFKQVEKMIPKNPETGEPVIAPNFSKPDGPKAMIQQLFNIQQNHNNRCYWVQDEAAQLFKAIEQPGSPLSEIKDYMLKIKDGDPVGRHNSKEDIDVVGTVMTQFFMNTIDSMARTLSEESMKDGMVRRYTTVMALRDDREHTDFPLYNLNNVVDEPLKDEISSVFLQDIKGNTYTFSKQCHKLYNTCYDMFWKRQYCKFMTGEESFYRTHMMETWKYSIFHHVINKKEGTVIGEGSFQYGLKIAMFLLNSFQSFIMYRAGISRSIKVQESKITQFMDFILANESKSGFGIRAVSRKFTMSKAEIFAMLDSIKIHNPKFKTKLFTIQKEEKKKAKLK